MQTTERRIANALAGDPANIAAIRRKEDSTDPGRRPGAQATHNDRPNERFLP